MLVLKITDKYRKAFGGFQWPESGPVECSDWDPQLAAVAGKGGLHGWGGGSGTYQHGFNEGVFLVVDVPDNEVTLIDGDKVKFRRGVVVFCGSRVDAVAYLITHEAMNDKSDPAWACLTPMQCVEVAMRAADRAVRQYAPKRLRARGLVEAAKRLEKLPRIKDRDSARNAANAADAAEREAARRDKCRLLGLIPLTTEGVPE